MKIKILNIHENDYYFSQRDKLTGKIGKMISEDRPNLKHWSGDIEIDGEILCFTDISVEKIKYITRDGNPVFIHYADKNKLYANVFIDHKWVYLQYELDGHFLKNLEPHPFDIFIEETGHFYSKDPNNCIIKG